jgi:hypothetical protein
MAVAVKAWKSTIIPTQGPSRSRGIQRVEFDVTQAAADNDSDFGDLTLATSAFWTSAEAHATYGATAIALRAHLEQLYPMASEVLIRSAVLESAFVRVVGATGAATQFASTPNATTGIPDVTYHAASAPTAVTYVLDFNLLEGKYYLAPKSFGTI